MWKYRSGRIFARQILLAWLAVAGAQAAFQIENSRLTADGQPLLVRGVIYSNTPIGSRWSDTIATSECLYARDFPLIRGLGANTVRTLARVQPGERAFRAGLEANDLYWLAGFPLDRFYDPKRSLSAGSAAGRALRQQILTEFREYAQGWAHEPRLVAFVFGNQVGADYNQKFAGSVADFYSLVREAAGALQGPDSASHLLTTAVAGIGDIGAFALGTDDASQPELAFWSIDLLGEPSLGTTLRALRNRTSKSFLVSQFGVDAYDGQVQAEDTEAQAVTAEALAREIEEAAAGGIEPLLGGVWAALLDEWWRGGVEADIHGTAGRLINSLADGVVHPGWLGLFGVAQSGIPGLDTLRVRDAYFALAGVWAGVAPMDLTQAGRPLLPPDGVRNMASGLMLVAPGGLITFHGEALGSGMDAAPGADLPQQLGTVSACVNGQPVPLLFAEEQEIRGQLPWGVSEGVAEALVYRAGVASNVVTVEVGAHAPGILDRGVFRAGMPCPAGQLNGVRPGSYLEVYATGLGTLPFRPPNGVAPVEPLVLAQFPQARLGGRELAVLYSGLLPGVVGVYQTNVHIPSDIVPEVAELRLSQGDVSSNPYLLQVTAADQPPAFSLRGPHPDVMVIQQGGPQQTAFLEVEGFNSFCDLVRFQISGLPPGVRATIPVGFPGQTVPLSLRAEPEAARVEAVPVTVTAESVVPETVSRTLRLTVLPGGGDIRVQVVSGGWLSGAPVARFEMEGSVLYEVFGGGPGRGFNFLTLDPQNGALGPVRSFDTWSDEEAVTAMEAYLQALPAGVLVLGAIADDGWLLIGDQTRAIIREALASELIDRLAYQYSWAIIARKGAETPIAEGLMPNGRVVLERVVSFPLP